MIVNSSKDWLEMVAMVFDRTMAPLDLAALPGVLRIEFQFRVGVVQDGINFLQEGTLSANRGLGPHFECELKRREAAVFQSNCFGFACWSAAI